MLEITVKIVVCKETVFEQIIIITVFWNSTDIIFLSVIIDFDNMTVLLIVEVLNKSIIIMIKFTVLELTVKE